MPLAERKRRWESLFHNVQTNDVGRWRDDFVACLKAADLHPAEDTDLTPLAVGE
jgi:trehalose 6-phosphate synthase